MEYSFFNKNDSSDSILNNYKLKELMNMFIIQRDEPRTFILLNNIDDYIEYQKTFLVPIFHELILTDKPRKFFLDLDYKVNVKDINEYEFKLNKYVLHIKSLKELVVSVFNSMYIGCFIEEADILEVVSHTDKSALVAGEDNTMKLSMNLILDKYLFADQTEFANFGNAVMESYKKNNSSTKIIDDKFFNVRSANFIQNRIIFSSKSGETRYKYPVVNGQVITKPTKELFYAFILQSDIGINGKKLKVLNRLADKECNNKYKKVKPGLITDSFIKDVLEHTKSVWHPNFVYRSNNEDKTIIYFDRARPSYCESCKEVHHNDNTLYYYISDSLSVYAGCLQNKSNKILVYRHVVQEVVQEEEKPAVVINAKPREYKKWYTPLADIGANIVNDNCNKISNSAFTNDNLLLIKAEMKMGKSKSLIDYISKNNTSFKYIVFISFRRTFSSEAKSKYEKLGFVAYNDIDGSIDLNIHNRVIVQVESLNRIKNPIQQIDLMILDEVESIWSQISSNNFRDFYGSYNMFEFMLRKSDKIIAMDANLSVRSSRLFAQLYANTPKTINIYINKYNTNWDITYYVISKFEWVAKIVKALESKESNIAIFSNSLKEAKILKTFISTIIDPKQIKLYGSKTKESTKRVHFSDVNKYWSQYRCVICTPTVSAGVSFETKHFDYVFGYFTDKSCNVETCRQMLGRVRDIGCKEIYITMSTSVADSSNVKPYLTDIRHIKLALARNRTELIQRYDSNLTLLNFHIDPITGDCKYDDNLQLNIILENIAFDNRSRNKFYDRMCKQISGEYNSLNILSPIIYKLNCNQSDIDNARGSYIKISEQTKKSLIGNIVSADNLDEEKYNELIDRSRNMGDINKQEHAAIDKYIIKRVTKLEFDDVQFDIIKSFSKKQKQQALIANRDIFNGNSWQDSIDIINNYDKYKYEKITNRSKDSVMFKGKIHMIIHEILSNFTYFTLPNGIDILSIVKTGVVLCDLGYNYDIELMRSKIIELLPMIDLPFDGKFKNKETADISFFELVLKITDIMKQVYGFRYRGGNGSITLLPMKNIIYIHGDSKYCNARLLTADKKYPVVHINYMHL